VELIFPHETDLKHVRDLQRSPHAWDSGFVMKEPPVRCWETPNDARSTYEVWLGELQERMRQSARAALQAHDLEPESKDGLEVLVVCSSFCGNVEICLYVCSIARPLLTPWRSSRPGRRQAAAGQAAAPKKAGGKDSDCKWASQFIGQRPSSRVDQKR